MSQRMDWGHLCDKLATMGLMVCLTRGSVAFNLRELPRLNDLLPLVVLAGLLLFLAVVLESGLWQISGRLFKLFTALTGLSSPAAYVSENDNNTLFTTEKSWLFAFFVFSFLFHFRCILPTAVCVSFILSCRVCKCFLAFCPFRHDGLPIEKLNEWITWG